MSSPVQTEHPSVGLQRTVLHVMERLASTTPADAAGTTLNNALDACLESYSTYGEIGQAQAAVLHQELARFISEPGRTQGQRFRARLLQQHLLAYVPESYRNATQQNVSTAQMSILPIVVDQVESAWRPQQNTWWVLKGALAQITGLRHEVAQQRQSMQVQREELTRKLDVTTEQVKNLEQEGNALRTELHKVSQPPAKKAIKISAKTAKKWNALPKQTALVKQLQIEIERAKRTQRPLCLARMALDATVAAADLEPLQPEQGDVMNQAVLACYAAEVLTGFRIYDIVARYDNLEIAILLPDTPAAGARRAVEKARNRASACYLVHEGESMTLPGFSAAISEYLPGESTADLLARTDAALMAVQAGR